MDQPNIAHEKHSLGLTMGMLAGCVAGAAIASAHLRSDRGIKLLDEAPGLFWISFVYVALCATGPFAAGYLVWSSRKLPAWGLSWVTVSIPWVCSLPWTGSKGSAGPRGSLFGYEAMLTTGTGVAMVILVALGYWYSQPENRGRGVEEQSLVSWIGLVLTGLWPIQIALNLILAAP